MNFGIFFIGSFIYFLFIYSLCWKNRCRSSDLNCWDSVSSLSTNCSWFFGQYFSVGETFQKSFYFPFKSLVGIKGKASILFWIYFDLIPRMNQNSLGKGSQNSRGKLGGFVYGCFPKNNEKLKLLIRAPDVRQNGGFFWEKKRILA